MSRISLLPRLLLARVRRKLERARRELSLAGGTRPSGAPHRAASTGLAEPSAARAERGPRGRRRGERLLQQLTLDLGPDRPRWGPSRLGPAAAHPQANLQPPAFARK